MEPRFFKVANAYYRFDLIVQVKEEYNRETHETNAYKIYFAIEEEEYSSFNDKTKREQVVLRLEKYEGGMEAFNFFRDWLKGHSVKLKTDYDQMWGDDRLQQYRKN